ncbi:MAG: hypothetical protein JRE71_11220 [Deltaproteobacteria bacterium]|nr:hypothetical protein [Deltaproteobacteria bacterium]
MKGAFGRVKQGLGEGSPRICLSGSEGIGKTSFCRALPKLLADTAQTAVVLDPRKPWREVRATIAKKFKLDGGAISRKALIAAREGSKQLVLVIDQAEALSHESLDHLDILLQYKCDNGEQLLHCVMLADLDAASTGTEIPLLWWLDKFTTMQLQFSPIPVEGLRHYVEKHLAKAGWAGGELFTNEALTAIHRNTGGVPRAINELCEKILIEGGARAITSITDEFIEELCGDARPESAREREPDRSAEWSIGDANDSPNAQELLDTASPDASPPADAELEADREALLEGTQDIASLLVTQDSPEPLRVEPQARVREENSPSLELEVEPAESRESLNQSFYGQKSPIGAPIGMNRITIATQSRKGRGGMIMGLLILALIAYVINSHFSMPTELIESAEVKIAETLEKQKTLIPEREVEPVPEAPEESSLLPSIIDRADEIVADSVLDLKAVLETESEVNHPAPANNDDDEVAAAPDLDTGDALQGSASKPSAIATPPAATATASTAVAESAVKPAPATTQPSSSFSSDLMVVNEYTAIPEAASAAPKLPLPVPADSEPTPTMTPPTTTTTTTTTPAKLATEAGAAPAP